jgi:hypothetical protein
MVRWPLVIVLWMRLWIEGGHLEWFGGQLNSLWIQPHLSSGPV